MSHQDDLLLAIVAELQPYMYSPSPPPPPSPTSTSFSPPPPPIIMKPKVNIEKSTSRKDTTSLEWICYHIRHTEVKDSQLFSKKEELEEKLTLSGLIHQQPSLMSNINHKVTKAVIKETESDLLCGKVMNLPMFMAFCCYYRKNILYHTNYIYMTFLGNSEETSEIDYMVFAANKKQYKLVETPSQEEIETIKKKCIFVPQYNKMMKGISTYKTNELMDIANQLSLEIPGNLNKKELYETILSKIGYHEPL